MVYMFNFKSILVMGNVLAMLLIGLSLSFSEDSSEFVVYKSFIKAGTTSFVQSQFKEQSYIDTKNINSTIKASEVIQLMRQSYRRKIRQQKISEISFAAELSVHGEKHYLVFCLPNRIYDLSENCSYIINEDGIEIVQKWYNKLLQCGLEY